MSKSVLLQKGSKAAKDYMAALRSMRKSKAKVDIKVKEEKPVNYSAKTVTKTKKSMKNNDVINQ